MILKKNLVFVILCLVLFSLIPTTQAHAYLDPGSGSLIIQVLIAGLLGLLAFMRLFKDMILSALRVKRLPKNDDDEHNPESDNI